MVPPQKKSPEPSVTPHPVITQVQQTGLPGSIFGVAPQLPPHRERNWLTSLRYYCRYVARIFRYVARIFHAGLRIEKIWGLCQNMRKRTTNFNTGKT